MTTETIEQTGAKTVSHAEWLAARKQFLAKEKEFTHLRDELSRQRRELPREKVEKKYVFEGPTGKAELADLFGGPGYIVGSGDALELPPAVSGLATYRTTPGPPACTTARGCFRKGDQDGG